METEDSSTPETETPETNADNTFFLPAEFPGSDSFKPGDSITLKVVSRNDDGEIEVSAGGGKEMSMSDDLCWTPNCETEPVTMAAAPSTLPICAAVAGSTIPVMPSFCSSRDMTLSNESP